MTVTSEPAISPKVVSSLFARLTADRDALYAALERCERRVAELSERLATLEAAMKNGGRRHRG